MPGDTEGNFMDNIRQVVGGSDHTVMIRNDGYVMTAGRNEHGQLGLPIADYSSVSVPTIVGNDGVTGFNADVLVNGVMVPPPAGGTINGQVINITNTQRVDVRNVVITTAGSGLNLFGMLSNTTEALPANVKLTADSGIVEIEEAAAGIFTITPIEDAVGAVVITVTDLASGQSLSFTLIIGKLNDQISPEDVIEYNFTDPMLVAGDAFTLALRADGTVWG